MEKLFQDGEVYDIQVIKAIWEKGLEDPETKKLIGDWTIGSQERAKNPIDLVLVEVRRAEIFASAGARDEASENLESALYRVRQELLEITPFKQEYIEAEKMILAKIEELGIYTRLHPQ